jgi:rRNA pseudouridine-1189 N-methylase Emg1 (Nep1/Mra1 family)
MMTLEDLLQALTHEHNRYRPDIVYVILRELLVLLIEQEKKKGAEAPSP